jgi:hypothetical protein
MNLTDDSVNELKSILETEGSRVVSFNEAKKIGTWLVQFFAHLTNKSIGHTPVAKQEHDTDTTNRIAEESNA